MTTEEAVARKVALTLYHLYQRYPILNELQKVQQKELFTIDEAAEVLGMSRSTVKNQIKAGRLKSVTIKLRADATRGSRRITRGQIQSYISKMEVEARYI